MPATPATQTVVVFVTLAFNTTEQQAHFVNEGCFGDDVARWMIGRLREHGIDTDEAPLAEDFGWSFGFRVADERFTFVLGYRPACSDGAAGEFIGTVERDCGLVASLFGRRAHGITRTAVEAIHTVLQGTPEISALAWHARREFDRGDESRGTPAP